MIARSASFRAASFSPSAALATDSAATKFGAVRLILAQRLQRVTRLSGGNLCSSGIAVKALRQNQVELSKRLCPSEKQSGIELAGLAAIGWLRRDFVQVSID